MFRKKLLLVFAFVVMLTTLAGNASADSPVSAMGGGRVALYPQREFQFSAVQLPDGTVTGHARTFDDGYSGINYNVQIDCLRIVEYPGYPYYVAVMSGWTTTNKDNTSPYEGEVYFVFAAWEQIYGELEFVSEGTILPDNDTNCNNMDYLTLTPFQVLNGNVQINP